MQLLSLAVTAAVFALNVLAANTLLRFSCSQLVTERLDPLANFDSFYMKLD